MIRAETIARDAERWAHCTGDIPGTLRGFLAELAKWLHELEPPPPIMTALDQFIAAKDATWEAGGRRDTWTGSIVQAAKEFREILRSPIVDSDEIVAARKRIAEAAACRASEGDDYRIGFADLSLRDLRLAGLPLVPPITIPNGESG